MTATVASGLAPLSYFPPAESDDQVRELMRRFAATSEVDLDPTVDEQRGFMIGDVTL